jgi:hypothetical protein
MSGATAVPLGDLWSVGRLLKASDALAHRVGRLSAVHVEIEVFRFNAPITAVVEHFRNGWSSTRHEIRIGFTYAGRIAVTHHRQVV